LGAELGLGSPAAGSGIDVELAESLTEPQGGDGSPGQMPVE